MLPKISDQLNQLRKYDVISSIDLSNAYWQVGLDEESKKLTAFVYNTPNLATQYQFERLPQGFRDSSAIFTNKAHRFIQKYNLFFCYSYIDNFLIASTEDSVKEDLVKVFNAFADAGLKIRLSKSHFFLRGKITLFGFTVNLKIKCIMPDIKKVEAILKIKEPE